MKKMKKSTKKWIWIGAAGVGAYLIMTNLKHSTATNFVSSRPRSPMPPHRVAGISGVF